MKYEIKQLNDTDAVVINSLETLSNNGDYFLGHPNYDKLFKWNMPEKTQHEGKQVWIKKIIATISPFKIEGLPMLELPNQEEDVEKLAHTKYAYISKNPPYTIITPKDKIEGFIEGYKAVQSKKYSEEDIKKAIAMAKIAITLDGLIDMDSWISNGYAGAEPAYTENDILQSLQKKQFPTSVELTEDLQIIKWYYK